MITPALAIDALWFEPGTPADAAHAINAKRARVKWVSPVKVQQHWAEAQRQGRLPPIERPQEGFSEYDEVGRLMIQLGRLLKNRKLNKVTKGGLECA